MLDALKFINDYKGGNCNFDAPVLYYIDLSNFRIIQFIEVNEIFRNLKSVSNKLPSFKFYKKIKKNIIITY